MTVHHACKAKAITPGFRSAGAETGVSCSAGQQKCFIIISDYDHIHRAIDMIMIVIMIMAMAMIMISSTTAISICCALLSLPTGSKYPYYVKYMGPKPPIQKTLSGQSISYSPGDPNSLK